MIYVHTYYTWNGRKLNFLSNSTIFIFNLYNGKNILSVMLIKDTASGIFIHIIRRYLQVGKGENWWESEEGCLKVHGLWHGNQNWKASERVIWWLVVFFQFQDTTGALPCCIHLPVCLLIIDPHSRAAKMRMSRGNEVLLYLIQRQCYEWGSLCQDPAGNQTT